MKISIIIVEYYSLPEIKQCIVSIKTRFQSLDYEVIVSSNSCYDSQSQQIIIGENLEVQWCWNEKNGGFAYAMNQGLKVASGDLSIIMNPDVIIRTDLENMISFINTHSEIGAIAPRIVDNDGIIQDSYRNYITLSSFISRHFFRIFTKQQSICEENHTKEQVQTVDWVIGAFIMVKREVYEKTNGLDEQYFLYCEDMDWCTRIRQAGYEVAYYPKAEICYEGSRSARKSTKYGVIFLKSLLRYWGKFGFYNIKPKRKEIIYTI